MVKSLLLVFLGCVLFSGCRDTPCGKSEAAVGFVGFQDQELDTIVFQRYVKGSQFASLKDSLIFIRGAMHYYRKGDTVLLPYGESNLTSELDYRIALPSAGKIYRIQEIYEPQTSGGNRRAYCINPIRSYRVNEQLVQGQERYDYIYLTR